MKGGKKLTYIINKKTLAILREKKNSRIIEDNQEYLIPVDPIDIIAFNCQINGSTLEGRQKGSTYLIGSKYKPPIIVNNIYQLIVIPTHSHRNKDCSWIILHNLANYYPHENQVLIEFQNQEKLLLPTSYTIFDKQVLRAIRLESTIRHRNNKKHL